MLVSILSERVCGSGNVINASAGDGRPLILGWM